MLVRMLNLFFEDTRLYKQTDIIQTLWIRNNMKPNIQFVIKHCSLSRNELHLKKKRGFHLQNIYYNISIYLLL